MASARNETLGKREKTEFITSSEPTTGFSFKEDGPEEHRPEEGAFENPMLEAFNCKRATPYFY